MRKTLLFATCCTVLSAACKKDDPNLSKRELLLAGKWQTIAATKYGYSMGVPVDMDLYAMWEPCVKDNFMVFNSNGTVDLNTGALICSNEKNDSGTYVLTDNDTRLVLQWSPGSSSDTFTVLELTATQLKITISSGYNLDYTTSTTTMKNIN